MQRTTTFARLVVAIVAMIGMSLAMAGTASAGVPQDPGFGICHATEAEGNPYVYIEPDNESYDAHLAHIGTEGGDRFATEAEFDAGECFDDQATEEPTEEPTEVPGTEEPTEVPGTEEPTEVPGTEEPTEVPTTAEPTDEPVVEVPNTGAAPASSSDQGILILSAIGSFVLLAAAAIVRRTRLS